MKQSATSTKRNGAKRTTRASAPPAPRAIAPTKSREMLRVNYVPLAELQRWPRNPKRHDEDALAASFQRFGFVAPIIVDEGTGKIVAGHGRLDALLARRAAGEPAPDRVIDRGDDWSVPVLRGVAFANEQEAEAYLLADNRLVESGGNDAELLAEILSRADFDTTGIGYTDEEVRELIARSEAHAASGLPGADQFGNFGGGGPTPADGFVAFRCGGIVGLVSEAVSASFAKAFEQARVERGGAALLDDVLREWLKL